MTINDNDMGEQSSIEWDKKQEQYETFNHWEEQQLINNDVPSEGTIEDTLFDGVLLDNAIYDSWDTKTEYRIAEAYDSIIEDVVTKILSLGPTESFTIDNIASYICQIDGETILILGCLTNENDAIDTHWFPYLTIQKEELRIYNGKRD